MDKLKSTLTTSVLEKIVDDLSNDRPDEAPSPGDIIAWILQGNGRIRVIRTRKNANEASYHE